jgi:purine-nucleoside phosphorylase
MAEKWNGSTLTVGGSAPFRLTRLSVRRNGSEINTTDSDDTAATAEVGLAEITIEAEGLGDVSTTLGSKATVVATVSGEANSITNCALFSKRRSGSLNGPMTTSLTFGPSRA